MNNLVAKIRRVKASITEATAAAVKVGSVKDFN